MKKLLHANRENQILAGLKTANQLLRFLLLLVLFATLLSAGLNSLFDEAKLVLIGITIVFLSTLVADIFRVACECCFVLPGSRLNDEALVICVILSGLSISIMAHATYAFIREPLTAELFHQVADLLREADTRGYSSLRDLACIILDGNGKEPYCSLWVALSVVCGSATLAEAALSLVLRQISGKTY